MTTDTELLEGLAREAFEAWQSEPLRVGTYHSNMEAHTAGFQAALQYIQQHVAPLVEALEKDATRLKAIRERLISYQYATQREELADYITQCKAETDSIIASLPPILRGGK